MKGIILAAGTGSRLYPITQGIGKTLLPVYNKPMIYYPLSVLMLAKIKEIMIITSEEFITPFRSLLGDGSELGISITYKIQKKPEGIAQAFHIGEDFIGGDSVCLVLGDNLFYGHRLPDILLDAREKIKKGSGSVISGYNVSNLRIPNLLRSWEKQEHKPSRIASPLDIMTVSYTHLTLPTKA